MMIFFIKHWQCLHDIAPLRWLCDLSKRLLEVFLRSTFQKASILWLINSSNKFERVLVQNFHNIGAGIFLMSNEFLQDSVISIKCHFFYACSWLVEETFEHFHVVISDFGSSFPTFVIHSISSNKLLLIYSKNKGIAVPGDLFTVMNKPFINC